MAYAQIAKIIRPDIQCIVKRSKVFSVLDSARDKPLIWVSAPAGSGKTTLVSSYLESQGIPCLWYRLDEGDKDPAAFFYYIRLAASKISPEAGILLPLLTPEYAHGLNTFARRYWERLFAMLLDGGEPGRYGQEPAHEVLTGEERPAPAKEEGLSQVPRVSFPGCPCLVLDNYQQVPENSVFHSLLASGLEMVPQGGRVMIISRHQPPAQYVKFRANNLMFLVGWEQIRFSLEETRDLVRGLVLQDSQLDSLGTCPPVDGDAWAELFQEVTDGWVAGVVLLAERLRWGNTEHVFSKSIQTTQEIIDYFAGEVCSSIDPDILDFLIKTSFLPQMTLYTAQAISGYRHARSILSELYRRNCFTEKRAGKPLVYQYHPLFRDYLNSRARTTLTEDEYLSLQQQAAELLAQTGQTEEAVEVLLSADRHDAAAEYILRKAESMTAGGRSQTLESWLSMLPVSLRDERPWLHYWMGVCRYPFAPHEALKHFTKAFAVFVNEGDDEGSLMAWCGAVDSILLERGDFRQLDFWIDWLHERLDQGLLLSGGELEARVTASMIGAILFRCPVHPHASAWLGRAEELVYLAWTPESVLRLFYLVMYLLMFGSTLKAGLVLKKMEPFVTPASPPFLRINWCLVKAMYAHMAKGAGEEAISFVEEGLSIANDTGIHVFDMYLLAQGTHGSLTTYDLYRAEHYLETMSASISGHRLWDVSYYHFLSACKEWCRDNIRAFSEHMQLALNLVKKIGCTLSCAVGHAGMALISLEKNRMDEVGEHLAKARLHLPGDQDTPEFLYLLIEAICSFRNLEEQAGTSLLVRALSIGRSQGFFTAPFWKRETMSLVCAKALEHGIETEYVRELISRRNLCPLPGKAWGISTLDWPFPLKIFALGGFCVQLNERPLQSGKKTCSKPLQMLKVLVACGCREVSHQKMTDFLYPDIDGDRANYSFKFTLYQLRTLLGSGSFLISQGGKLSLDERYCFVDAEVFLQLCNRIRKLYDSGSIRRASVAKEGVPQDDFLQLCRKALDLYRGDFLQHEVADFAVGPREMFRSRFLGLVDIAGAVLEEDGRSHEAVNLYERAIESDPLQEKFYRRLMRCYSRQGQEAAAISVYRRCQRVLDSKLGVKPSPKTRKTYNALIQG